MSIAFDKHELLESKLQESGQNHILSFILGQEGNKESLCGIDANHRIIEQLNSLNLISAVNHLKHAQSVKDPIVENSILPVTAIKLSESTLKDVRIKEIGEDAIRNGEVAAIILSGG